MNGQDHWSAASILTSCARSEAVWDERDGEKQESDDPVPRRMQKPLAWNKKSERASSSSCGEKA
jgi:hypothetical protein